MLGVLCIAILFIVIGGFKFLVGGIFLLIVLKWALGVLTMEANVNVGKK